MAGTNYSWTVLQRDSLGHIEEHQLTKISFHTIPIKPQMQSHIFHEKHSEITIGSFHFDGILELNEGCEDHCTFVRGAHKHMVEVIEHVMGVTVNLQRMDWGMQLTNGSYTGTLKALAERTIDLAITITDLDNLPATDFPLIPTIYSYMSFVTSVPKPIRNWYTPYRSFSLSLWITILLTVVFASLFLIVFTQLQEKIDKRYRKIQKHGNTKHVSEQSMTRKVMTWANWTGETMTQKRGNRKIKTAKKVAEKGMPVVNMTGESVWESGAEECMTQDRMTRGTVVGRSLKMESIMGKNEFVKNLAKKGIVRSRIYLNHMAVKDVTKNIKIRKDVTVESTTVKGSSIYASLILPFSSILWEPTKVPKIPSAYPFIGCWLLFCIVIVVVFDCNLKSTLINPAHEPTLNSLLDIYQHPEYEVGFVKLGMSSFDRMFEDTHTLVHKSIQHRINYYTIEFETCMEAVLDHRAACFAPEMALQVVGRVNPKMSDKHGNMRLHFAEEKFGGMCGGISSQKGSTLSQLMGRINMVAFERGFPDKANNDQLEAFSKRMWAEMEQELASENRTLDVEFNSKKHELVPLNNQHLMGVYLMYGFPWLINISVLVVEIVVAKVIRTIKQVNK